MANTIKLKRGSGSDPSASDLSVGEIAIRTDSGKLFTKKDNGSVAEISGSGGIDDGDKGDITVSNSGATFTIDSGVVTSAKIADGTIVNADISGSAAIAGSKIQASGLVNAGVMTAAQHNKLAGIEANATADMTGTEILATISGENIILGTIASTGNSTFAGNITMSSSDGGSSAAPELDLYRNSASPADADYLGQIKFTGESDDGSKEVYAKITGKIGDASSGTEDGILEIAHRKAGSNNISARFTSTDLKLINGTGLEVAGDISCDGDLTIGGTNPSLLFTDSDDNPDYVIRNDNGVFKVRDTTNSRNPILINTDGHIDIAGNVDFAAGIDVTGNISCTGTVDGRDLATDGSKLDGIESGATADQTKSDIDALGIAASTAATLLTARTIAGVSFDGSANISLNNNAITNGAGYITSSDSSITNKLPLAGGTLTGNLTISNVAPRLILTDTNNDPDYQLKNFNGGFQLDQGTSDTKFGITTDGHVEFPNDDQEIRIGQGSDLKLFHDGTDSFIKQATATPLKIQGNGSNGAEVHIQARPDEEGIKLLNNSGASKIELYYDNTKRIETTDYGSLTSGVHSVSNGILEVKAEIGSDHTLSTGYNAIAVDPTIANGVTITVPSGAVWSIV